MKLIHCADLHIDSKMNRHFDSETAQTRRAEILANFTRMVDYARENQVEAILIAGDLFDTGVIKKSAKSVVESVIRSNQDIMFFYVRGNHDSDGFIDEMEDIPENLKLFGRRWTSYELCDNSGSLVITGIELEGDPSSSLLLDGADFNIVMMHGQVAELATAGRKSGEIIPIKNYRNRGIDYLALGHVHSYKEDRLDARGTWCYPGCLEGRGFDEAGEHGFVVLNVDTAAHRYTSEFVPFAQRKVIWEELDASDALTSVELEPKISALLAGHKNDLVRIELTGEVDIEAEIDTLYLTKRFADSVYVFDIKNSTSFKVDYASYMHDVTLKGEFVRRVYEMDELDEKEKAEVIMLGLNALEGK